MSGLEGDCYRNYFDLDRTAQASPIGAPHPYFQVPNPTPLDLSRTGSRLTTTVIRDGYLWTSHHVGLDGTDGIYDGDATGQSVDRSGIQWIRLRVGTGIVPGDTLSYDSHGRIYDDCDLTPRWYSFPSLAVNTVGGVIFGFSGSSETEYISALYSFRMSDGTITATPLLLKSGEGEFMQTLRGDYSQTCLDPADSLTFWTVQEYARPIGSTPAQWGTWIGKVTISP
jgi:hypothetical protein